MAIFHVSKATQRPTTIHLALAGNHQSSFFRKGIGCRRLPKSDNPCCQYECAFA